MECYGDLILETPCKCRNCSAFLEKKAEEHLLCMYLEQGKKKTNFREKSRSVSVKTIGQTNNWSFSCFLLLLFLSPLSVVLVRVDIRSRKYIVLRRAFKIPRMLDFLLGEVIEAFLV